MDDNTQGMNDQRKVKHKDDSVIEKRQLPSTKGKDQWYEDLKATELLAILSSLIY
jgi:hypothetical protein